MKKLGRIGGLTLDAEQNIESCGASGRNRWGRRPLSCGFHRSQYDGSAGWRAEIRGILRAESFAGLNTIAPTEISGGSPILAFQLQFEKFDRRFFAAAHQNMIVFHFQFG